MNQTFEERIAQQWVIPGVRIWSPARVVLRFFAASLWITSCYFAILSAGLLGLYSSSMAARAKWTISRKWLKGMTRILGMRITVRGYPPKPPYFLVANHVSWVDLFAVGALCETRFVVMAEMARVPLVGRLLKGMRPIFIRRVKDDTRRVNTLLCEAIRAGDSVTLAPESVISPGKTVRKFRAGLLTSAVEMRRPVHYMSLTYRTPEGSPPPSVAVVYGPDPFYRTADGKIPDSEIEAWGNRERPGFLVHLTQLLSLPWHEAIVRFAPDPIWSEDRITLANKLHEAVVDIFTPVK